MSSSSQKGTQKMPSPRVNNVKHTVHRSSEYLEKNMAFYPLSLLQKGLMILLDYIYVGFQCIIKYLFTPPPPPKDHIKYKPYAKVAVIGAGLTGISTAAHFISHGFEVTVFEAENDVGGIWARVNRTSGLQINSILYRFFPAVIWKRFFPHRDQILQQIQGVWKEYQLARHTRLGTRVTKVTRHSSSSDLSSKYGSSKWIINDEPVVFDAVVCTIGTCGEPKWIELAGVDKFTGTVIHSSKIDGFKSDEIFGKNVAIVGSGASAAEAATYAVNCNAKQASILARHDKWIIPRNVIVDTLLSCQPVGMETPFSWIVEGFLRWFHYRDMKDMSPANYGIFEGTPIVNNEILDFARSGKVKYCRGDVKKVEKDGISFNKRPRGSIPGDPGSDTVVKADIIVLATGFQTPSTDFLPQDLFPTSVHGDYKRPNLYLQNFTVEDWSVLMTNAAFKNALGTVGHFHIGIYARILALFLMEKDARPRPKDMRLWVDCLRFVKRNAPGGALGFFTYAELMIWVILFHIFRIYRLPWLPFILFGWGVRPYSDQNKDKWVPYVNGHI